MLQIVLVLFTALSSPLTLPQNITKGGGGPDAYGYRYIDNDTVAPNVPVYNWKDISTVGTRVLGLMDDNVVGPFPIGFNFPYYWYRVNSFYVSSNGYISFSDNFNGSSPFSNVPNPARPNDVVAPLMSDLDFSSVSPNDTARCFYWTNATLDTCIISYINVRWWYPNPSQSAATRCTFQIILSKPDSSITFQYKRIVGAPYGGWSPTYNTTGIENVTGTVGLSYLNGVLPSQNALHETLAVKFYPPQTTSYQVSDIGILNAMNENSGGFFILNNTPKTLWAKVKNTGNQPLSNCSAFVRVRNSANAIVYSNAVAIGSMTPTQVESIAFGSWTPTANGVYRTTFRAKVSGDMYVGNDSVILETRVMTYPGELMFDDGVLDQGTSWQGNNGGMGMKFTPPQYPCRITGAKAYLYYQNSPVTCTLWVLRDDGPGGSPGSVLGRGNITVTATSTAPAWYQINLSPAPVISSGSFFVGVTSNGTSDPVYCIDTSFPVSRQSWEYTGSWAPYRSNYEDDIMMRAMVELGPWITETEPTQMANNNAVLSIYPNPIVNSAKIKFHNTPSSQIKTVEIYNIAGEQVNTLSTDQDYVIWHGNDSQGQKLNRGVYFVKLNSKDASVVKVLLAK